MKSAHAILHNTFVPPTTERMIDSTLLLTSIVLSDLDYPWARADARL